MANPFEVDLIKIRQRARQAMEKGALTDANNAATERVIRMLNQALATEIVCVLRYKNHYYRARGARGRVAAEEFKEHADAEQRHADALAERIRQLGGTPQLDPAGLSARSHTEYREGDNLRQMVIEDLVAERIAIELYTESIRWLGDDDPTTRRLMESILADEEEHADDLAELLPDL